MGIAGANAKTLGGRTLRIGIAEKGQLLAESGKGMETKTAGIDTGAEYCSLGVKNVEIEGEEIELGKVKTAYVGEKAMASFRIAKSQRNHIWKARVVDSLKLTTGEQRYVVEIDIQINGQPMTVLASLSDRSDRTFKMNVGKDVLKKYSLLVAVEQDATAQTCLSTKQ